MGSGSKPALAEDIAGGGGNLPLPRFRNRTMSVFRRSLSAAAASASAASAVSAASAGISAAVAPPSTPVPPPPAASSSRPSALLAAYVNQPPPPAAKPDTAWRRDMFGVMAASPARECAVTAAHLPSAFMVNFRVGEGADSGTVLPDRLQHPKFKRRRAGRSFWAALHRDALDRLQNPKGEFHSSV